MFFVLSKVFWAFAQPLSLVVILLGFAYVARWMWWRFTAFLARLAAFVILFVAVFSSAGALMLGPLEDRFPRPDPAPETIAGIVMLGGGFEGGVNLARGGYELNSAGDRIVETAILAQRYPEARVVISGGTGTLILDGEGDADTAPRLLEALGVARDRLVLENRSRNTHENALFSKELAKPEPGQTWLLVTSAFHMPRSMALFRKAGFEVVAWPTDYRTRGDETVELFSDNPVDSVQNLSLGVREWIGLIAYWIGGRIDEPFPKPLDRVRPVSSGTTSEG